ncbi:hypothetical protein D3C80_1603570 [compost metagenome]
MRRTDHRVSTPDHAAIGLGHAKPGELPGPKAKPRIASHPQAEQARRQWLDVQQGLAGKLFGTGGHDGLRE